MPKKRRLLDLINNSASSQAVNKQFLQDVMIAIEKRNKATKREPSAYYKPSGLNCLRMMYFVRTRTKQDTNSKPYNMIGMADTGTARHEAIQDVLLYMNETGSRWKYVDVAEYIQEQQAKGYCSNIVVKEKVGAETHLIDEALNLSFRCDGVILDTLNNEYYLFEFKNQTSFKFNGKNCVDPAHHNQVICYCNSLNLNKALVLYENRDVCELECPEIFLVTSEMKGQLVNTILTCEQYVVNMQAPPKCDNEKVCRFCDYREACRKAG